MARSPPRSADDPDAVLARGGEWLSDRVRRYRDLPVAGDPSLCRLGPAGVLLAVHAAAACNDHPLAGDRRAGADHELDFVAGLQGVDASDNGCRVRRRHRGPVRLYLAAMDRQRTDARFVYASSGVGDLLAGLGTGAAVPSGGYGAGGIGGIHDRRPAIKRAIGLRIVAGAVVILPAAWAHSFG